jgi:hypothetical protein
MGRALSTACAKEGVGRALSTARARKGMVLGGGPFASLRVVVMACPAPSAAFCAWLAAVKIARLSSLRTFSHDARYSSRGLRRDAKIGACPYRRATARVRPLMKLPPGNSRGRSLSWAFPRSCNSTTLGWQASDVAFSDGLMKLWCLLCAYFRTFNTRRNHIT